MEYLFLLVVFIVIVIISGIRNTVTENKKIEKKLIDEYGNDFVREIDTDTIDNIKEFFTSSEKTNLTVDDTTWSDLNMDEVYKRINNTNSSVGQEYLYNMLRNPVNDIQKIEGFNILSDGFDENQCVRLKVQKEFYKLGYAHRISVYGYIKRLMEFEPEGNMLHYALWIMALISVLLLLNFNTTVGVILFVLTVSVSVVTYYRCKAHIEAYFLCVKWLVRMITCADNISGTDAEFLEKYNKRLKEILNNTKKLKKRVYLLSGGTDMSGSLAEVLMDYVRILTHIDIIKFNHIVRNVKTLENDIIEMYEILGFIESSIAVASFRKHIPYWCRPEFDNKSSLKIYELYHPLITNPVANTIETDKNILLTGSNASGKSTFLKSVAINAILSQTIDTSVSKECVTPFFRIVSSMSHKDDIINGDSYYMVEIKALKRIIDATDTCHIKTLVFLDEVLRGTNTIERIAASTQILKSFANENTICFAATHDIELTKLLEDDYINYHFDEAFTDNDVRYSYRLLNGAATTRNAIKLLWYNGYPKEICEKAEAMTENFERNGIWEA